jgi:hypothetical protein
MLMHMENRHWEDAPRPPRYALWSVYLQLRPFTEESLTGEQQWAMACSMTDTAETGVRSVNLASDPARADIHVQMQTQERNLDESISTSAVATLGAFAIVGVRPQAVQLITAHARTEAALELDRLQDPAAVITDERYHISDEYAQELYEEDRERFAHLLSYSHQLRAAL